MSERLDEQVRCAEEWRDQINTYFFRKSGVPDERGSHDLLIQVAGRCRVRLPVRGPAGALDEALCDVGDRSSRASTKREGGRRRPRAVSSSESDVNATSADGDERGSRSAPSVTSGLAAR